MDPFITEVIEVLQDCSNSDKTGHAPSQTMLFPTCIHILCYVMQFLSNSREEHDAVRQAIMRLASLCSESRRDNWLRGFTVSNLNGAIKGDLLSKVGQFFNVPSKMSFKDISLGQTEILASFIDFLLRIWNSDLAWESDWNPRRDIRLKEDLKYLLTFLGDTPFQCAHQTQEALDTLLVHYESFINKVGYSTFKFLNSSRPRWLLWRSANRSTSNPALYPYEDYPAHYEDYPEHVYHSELKLLTENIKRYCNRFSWSQLATCATRRGTNAIDSVFIIDSLLEDLESLINSRFSVTIDDEMRVHIETLHKELKLSRILMEDTKMSRGRAEYDELNKYFITTRDIAYEAEFLVNSRVVGNIPGWYLELRILTVIQELEVNRQRIQTIPKYFGLLHVTNDLSGDVSGQVIGAHTQVVGGLVVGFKNEKKHILHNLTTDGRKGLECISLVGMPGVGKTTLAKYLFENPRIKNHFDRRAWCVISQISKTRKVLTDILRSLSDQKEDFSNASDDDLGLRIHKRLIGYRYLIIFDDIWESSKWNDVSRYFPDDTNGSRIMFSSRIKDAAPNESIVYTLPLLSEVDCLDLLLKKVFGKKNFPSRLKCIGKRIAKRCNGLPLAVVAIAGVLASLGTEESAWERVESNLNLYILDDGKEYGKVLEFSYEHLPNHLKICFLYLGRFPEAAEIHTRKLRRLWIAEGFIPKEKERSQEDVAKEYLFELINRSLMLITKWNYDGGVKVCGIHDLLRDMCLKKADEENLMKSTTDHLSIYERHRRLNVYCTSSNMARHFGLHCRSFSGNLPAPSSRLPQMPLLRIIDLSIERGDNELKEIHRLFYLRYLHTANKMGPLHLASNLVNLEFLDVKHVGAGDRITSSMILKMVKLRHLKIRFGVQFREDCDRCDTSNLESLSLFNFYIPADHKILKYCPRLRKLKCQCDPSNFPDVGSLTELETLDMCYRLGPFKGELRKVNFHSTLKNLSLRGIGLSWNEMSKIGKLTNLKVLKLRKNAFVGDEWRTSEGEFRTLRFLELDSLVDLKEWITNISQNFCAWCCESAKNCKIFLVI